MMIVSYFLQDHVAPSEGPMADEVSQREFHEWALVNPLAPIEFDETNQSLYLRLDKITAQGLSPKAPEGAVL